MTQHQHTGDGQPSPVSLLRRWLRLAGALILLAAFIYFAPHLERLPGVGQSLKDLRESGINVGAWYYDDVEEYFEAEEYVRKRLGKKDRFH
ncbi:MAG: hypothetical protein ACLFQG_07045 [Desulfovermiculus sp.]